MARQTQPETASLRDLLDHGDHDEVVDQLVHAGPDDARTILPQAQAETLVHRDLLDHGREQTADALDVSVWTVDDRLRRGRDNSQAVASVARVLLDLGVLDADDLALEPDTVARDDADDTASAEEPTLEDETPGSWARIMALDAVTEVTRSRDGTAVSVQVDDATDDDRDEIHAALDDLGLEVYATEEYGESGREKIRAQTPESVPDPVEDPLVADDDEQAVESAEDGAQDDADPEDVEQDAPDEDAAHGAQEADESEGLTCHYCGDEFTLDTDHSSLLGFWNTDAEHPACEDCLADVAMNDSELDPLPEFRDRDDDGLEDGGDEQDDEDDVETFACEDCGAEFDTPGGLGGHRRYCDADPVEQDPADEDVATLPLVGPKKADDLRSRGFETVGDVAEVRAPDLMSEDLVGQKTAVKARHEARKRLGLGQHAEDETDE